MSRVSGQRVTLRYVDPQPLSEPVLARFSAHLSPELVLRLRFPAYPLTVRGIYLTVLGIAPPQLSTMTAPSRIPPLG